VTGPIRRPDLHDMIRELCEDTQHRELYMRKRKPRYHVTNNPPLLVQLKAAATPKASVDSGTARPASSKPSAAIDSIDTLLEIDKQAAAWLRVLGQDDPGNVVRCVVQVGALAPSQDHCGRKTPKRGEDGQVICCTFHDIESDVRRWWSKARVVTSWDLPPFRPDNTCPICAVRGSLRIRVEERLAMCTEEACREVWDETTIGLLADHIRAENHEGEEDKAS
jgi:hypothetical protein